MEAKARNTGEGVGVNLVYLKVLKAEWILTTAGFDFFFNQVSVTWLSLCMAEYGICHTLAQWFLTWVRSNPRGSVSQSQGFGGGQDTHPTHMIRDDTPRLAIIGCR